MMESLRRLLGLSRIRGWRNVRGATLSREWPEHGGWTGFDEFPVGPDNVKSWIAQSPLEGMSSGCRRVCFRRRLSDLLETRT
jgi:hypothetical protein